MSEKEPSLTLNLANGEKMEMTPRNSTLYTFLGRAAIGAIEIDSSLVNHIFVRTSDEDAETASGMYFFAEFETNNYRTMTHYMNEHHYPMILNMRDVPECDLKAWSSRSDAEVARFSSQIPNEL